ncbi:hypothetical protein ACIRJM_22675 [Streptomyces sp. NPDC102405]|uniref:hypothetical protein n=1 Tax=Streptomyces sp. NPDC102405 TaxID=3366170 RepID=UPI00382DA1B2
MTTQADTDPRIGALMELTQGLILKYTELASNLAAHLPDEVKAELVEHTQTLVQEARERYEEIALMGSAPPVDAYRLSSRPGVVGGQG